MGKKIEYKDAETFMIDCARDGSLPAIHWRVDRGFIWFRPSKNYIVSKDEIHLFYSSSKKMLDAIWNSIGLIKHAIKLVDEV